MLFRGHLFGLTDKLLSRALVSFTISFAFMWVRHQTGPSEQSRLRLPIEQATGKIYQRHD